MRVGILGPLRVTGTAGRTVPVGGPRLRALLALLALSAGREVTTEALIDGLWGTNPPAGTTNALQSLVSRLRRALRDATDTPATATQTEAAQTEAAQAAATEGPLISSGAAGYSLAVEPADVDAYAFERLVNAGRSAARAGDPETAAHQLAEAEQLWRGPALADIGDAPFVAAAVSRLHELRLAATEDRLAARLRLGHPDLAELEALATAHPMRERIGALLIRALAATGRRADALATYDRIRRRLSTELGLDPSPELRDSQLAVLRGEPTDARPLTNTPDNHPNPATKTAPTPPYETPKTTNPETEIRPVRRTNLRSRLTSFVGRDGELKALTERLARTRLITLVGPGGAGKTRLAGEGVTAFADQHTKLDGGLDHSGHEGSGLDSSGLDSSGLDGSGLDGGGLDGVWMVELAPIADPLEVPPAVLAALGGGQRDTGSVTRSRGRLPVAREATDRLLERLRDQRAVVVLDNCEHVVAAAAQLAETLLGGCPDLRVLATSREPLGVGGEHLFPVGPLELPPAHPDLAHPERANPKRAKPELAHPDLATPPSAVPSAVRLFVERAVAVRPDYRLTADQGKPVAEICRRLDGMPLAIELAAARIRVMSAAEIASRLDDRFRLLTGGSRTVLPRHQTLRAVVEWSWDLLTEPERTVLRRLSVFAGGAALTAIERVCADELHADELNADEPNAAEPSAAEPSADEGRGGGVVPVERVLEVLGSLVDKSLVEAVPIRSASGTRVRYRLLETVKAYAAEELAKAGETEALAAVHAACFLALTRRADGHLLRAEQIEWLDLLADDHENIVTAMRWTIDAPDPEAAASMVLVMAWFWLLRGSESEGRKWFTDVLAVADDLDVNTRLGLFCFHALFSLTQDGYVAGVRSLIRAQRMRDDAPDADPVLSTMLDLSWAILHRGDPDVMPDLTPFFEASDPWMAAFGRIASAHGYEAIGDRAAHEREVLSALRGFRQVGDRWGTTVALRMYSPLLAQRGELERAVEAREEAYRHVVELGTLTDVPALATEVASLRGDLGQLDEAEAQVADALMLARKYGLDHGVAMALTVRGRIARFRGDAVSARADLTEAVETWGIPSTDQFVSWILCELAYADVALGEIERSWADLRRGWEIQCQTTDEPVAAHHAQTAAALLIAEAASAIATESASNTESASENVLAKEIEAAELVGVATMLRGGGDFGDPDAVATEARLRAALGDDRYDEAVRAGAATDRAAAHKRIANLVGSEITPFVGRRESRTGRSPRRNQSSTAR